VEVLVSLQYSNGRIYETSYVTSVALNAGSEFDLHGRHWLVVGLAKQQTRRDPNTPPRTLCVSTGVRSSPTP
jgi:beta-xylosidase